MLIPEQIQTAINLAIDNGVRFVCYALPEDNTVRFFSDLQTPNNTAASDEQFEIGLWLKPYSDKIIIRNCNTADETISYCQTSIPSNRTQPTKNAPITLPEIYNSTSKAEYLLGARNIIESCRQRNGKTVYSRVICGRNPQLNPAQVANNLFERFPGTFRHIYHTEETGTWLGATPETLLDCNFKTDTFKTVALAGTRSATNPDNRIPWDKKNTTENKFVVDFLSTRLKELNLPHTIEAATEVRYGVIEHLCHNIHGTLNGCYYSKIIDTINPTPALCGHPLNDAIEDISRAESHQRQCYGGFIAIHTSDNLRAFVNLRCCRITGTSYCIYGGGGLVGNSIPETEYDETAAKTAVLHSIVDASTYNCTKKNQ